MVAFRLPGWVPTAIRAMIGFALIGAGFFLMGGFLSFLLGVGLMMAGALVLQPILSTWLSSPAGRFFYPEERFDRAQPLYSIAEAKVAKEAFEEAMTFYAHIAEQYPQELKAYVDRIRICVVHLHDPVRAEQVLNEGREAISDPRNRERLESMYRAIVSLSEAPADWNRARTLALKNGSPGVQTPGDS